MQRKDFEFGRTLFVGGLPWSASDGQLSEIYGQVGTVVSCRITVDRDTRRSRGFGFVTMSSEREAERAIAALDGTDFGGRRMCVSFAKPRETRVGDENLKNAGAQEPAEEPVEPQLEPRASQGPSLLTELINAVAKEPRLFQRFNPALLKEFIDVLFQIEGTEVAFHEDTQRDAIHALILNSPVEQPKVEVLQVKLYQRLAKDLRMNPNALYDLSPRQLEELVQELMELRDYHVELSKQGGDGGVDLRATKRDEFSQVLTLVQCKHRPISKAPLGVDVVRATLGALYLEKASNALIVTTAKAFSQPAIQLRDEYPMKLALAAYDDLVSWVRSTEPPREE